MIIKPSVAVQLINTVVEAKEDCLTGSDGRTLFTVQAKRLIIEKVEELKLSIYYASKILTDDGQRGDWVGNLRRWSKQLKTGRLNIQNAVSVRAEKPSSASVTENPFHTLFDKLVSQERRTFAEVETMFAMALDRKKLELSRETKQSLEVLLKAKGLTLDDLKSIL